MKQKKCKRCGNDFLSNPLIQGDDVCSTCDEMTCLTFWYPRLFRLKFPMPRTMILHTNLPLSQLLDDNRPKGVDVFISQLKLMANQIGTPSIFLRTGYLSNKHDWGRSCFLNSKTLKDDNEILRHVTNLVEMSCLATIDRMMPIDFWVVREFLTTEKYFNYFNGNMPITKERRYFVRNGEIECHHNYWDRKAFKNDIDEDLFAKLSSLSKEDEKTLNKMALYVSKLFNGYWSIDFLKTKNNGKHTEGWVLTDMAIGEMSYHQKHEKKIEEQG